MGKVNDILDEKSGPDLDALLNEPAPREVSFDEHMAALQDALDAAVHGSGRTETTAPLPPSQDPQTPKAFPQLPAPAANGRVDLRFQNFPGAPREARPVTMMPLGAMTAPEKVTPATMPQAFQAPAALPKKPMMDNRYPQMPAR
ncbi:MAG: hypothetical protein H0W66_00960 [Chthoniobacterales bacterium]|nr:hypothetical protein [Chthoniobacterales bacterium]